MSATMSLQESNSYRLQEAVSSSFVDEMVLTRKAIRLAPEDRKYSVSIQALCFAMIQRIDHVVEFIIQHYKAKNPAALKGTQMLQRYRLAPIHIATMLQQESLVSKLLDAGVDPNVRDQRQWTSLHHAALSGNQKIIELLKRHGADQTLLTDTEGTFEDILRLTQPPQSEQDAPIQLLYEGEDGKISQLTHGKFEKLTGAVYIEENYVARTWMIDQWRDGEQNEGPTSKWNVIDHMFKEKYNQFLLKPPMHLLKKITHNDEKKQLAKSPGFGLLARTDHKAKEILGEYRARVDIHDGNDYTINDDWNGLNFRSDIARANDGFPNSIVLRVCNSRNLAERCLLVATTEIRAGEQMCYDYSSAHLLKLQPYVEFRPSALRQFVNNADLQKIVAIMKGKNVSQDVFDQAILYDQFKYISETPFTLFTMVWDGSIKASRLKEFVDVFFSMRSSEYQEARTTQLEVIKWAEVAYKIKKALSDSKQENMEQYTEKFSARVNGWIEKMNIHEILSSAEDTLPFYVKAVLPEESIEIGSL